MPESPRDRSSTDTAPCTSRHCGEVESTGGEDEVVCLIEAEDSDYGLAERDLCHWVRHCCGEECWFLGEKVSLRFDGVKW